METKRSVGSGDSILDAGIIVAAILTYAKTADVFAFFAPQSLSNIIGFDVSYIYGLISALLIEGVMLALHFNRNAHGYAPAETTKWTLLLISFLCQVYDGFLTTNTLSQQSDELKFVFQYLVPGLPILVLLLIFAIRRLPNQAGTYQASWRGLKSYLPDFHAIWYGKPVSTEQVAQDDEQEDDEPTDTGTTSVQVPKGKTWPAVVNKLQKTDLLFIVSGDEDDIMRKYGIRRRSVRNWRIYAERELARRG